MSGEWWGFIFLMLIMKVPIAYLAGVVWYACKAPDPPEPAVKLVEVPVPGAEVSVAAAPPAADRSAPPADGAARWPFAPGRARVR